MSWSAADLFQWVALEDWAYTAQFSLPQRRQAVFLNLTGIDTIGEVYIDGALVATTNNQFLRYLIPIADALLPSQTTHTINITIRRSGEPASNV